MSLEKFSATDENKDSFKKALEKFPSSFKSIDESVPGTAITPEEIELRELAPKVEYYIHQHLGNAMPVENEIASKEEVSRFVELLKDQSARLNEVADDLEKILK